MIARACVAEVQHLPANARRHLIEQPGSDKLSGHGLRPGLALRGGEVVPREQRHKLNHARAIAIVGATAVCAPLIPHHHAPRSHGHANGHLRNGAFRIELEISSGLLAGRHVTQSACPQVKVFVEAWDDLEPAIFFHVVSTIEHTLALRKARQPRYGAQPLQLQPRIPAGPSFLSPSCSQTASSCL